MAGRTWKKECDVALDLATNKQVLDLLMIAVLGVILFVIFAVLAAVGVQNPFVPVAFLTGGFFSGLCGYIGMKTATHASSRTAQACRHRRSTCHM